MYVIACEWWQGCMAWQASCSLIKLSGVLPISVVSSVAQTQFGSLCCIPASKALIPLVDSFVVDATHGASIGPRSHSHVPRVPRGLCVANVHHTGVLVVLDAENHVGFCQRTKRASSLCPAQSPCSFVPFLALGRARASRWHRH